MVVLGVAAAVGFVLGSLVVGIVAVVRHGRLQRALAAADQRLVDERQAAAGRLALIGEAETSLRDAFGALSAEALRNNNASFLELAKTQLGQAQRTAAAELVSPWSGNRRTVFMRSGLISAFPGGSQTATPSTLFFVVYTSPKR